MTPVSANRYTMADSVVNEVIFIPWAMAENDGHKKWPNTARFDPYGMGRIGQWRLQISPYSLYIRKYFDISFFMIVLWLVSVSSRFFLKYKIVGLRWFSFVWNLISGLLNIFHWFKSLHNSSYVIPSKRFFHLKNFFFEILNRLSATKNPIIDLLFFVLY